jgi:hypothetical protein
VAAALVAVPSLAVVLQVQRSPHPTEAAGTVSPAHVVVVVAANAAPSTVHAMVYVSGSASASLAAVVTSQPRSTGSSGAAGSIATTGALGAELLTVTLELVTALPAPSASLGVTVTATLSPRLKYVAPERVLPVAATATPFTVHRYARLTVSPSASLATTEAVTVSFV